MFASKAMIIPSLLGLCRNREKKTNVKPSNINKHKKDRLHKS